jgi:hypothetical protein
VLRLYNNVLAYVFLLTSRWPGVIFNEGPNDQLSLAIDHVPLNRASVFFRIVLVIPGSIVSGVLSFGSYPFLVVMWLWGLVTGREPQVLHQTLALVLRFQIRFQAYTYMLSPTQPFQNLMGDGIAGAGETEDSAQSSESRPTSSLPTTWLVVKDTRAYVVAVIVLGVVLYMVRAHG